MRNVAVRWVLFCGVPCALILLATLRSTMPDCPWGASCSNGAFLVLIVSSVALSVLPVLWLVGLCVYALTGTRRDAPAEGVMPLIWARSLIVLGAGVALAVAWTIRSGGCTGPGCADGFVVAVVVWLVGVTALAWSWLGPQPKSSLTLASVAFVSALFGAALSSS